MRSMRYLEGRNSFHAFRQPHTMISALPCGSALASQVE
jgi:hypothetical protein